MSNLLPVAMSRIMSQESVANTTEPDQMPHSDMGLHCLLRHVSLNSYGNKYQRTC